MAEGSICAVSHYQFKDQVPKEFQCMNCSEVCNRLTKASCCGGRFCYATISICRENGRPCPACGEESYEISEAREQQKKIMEFTVSCTFKEKGCTWSGPLNLLKQHLSPQGGCQFVSKKGYFEEASNPSMKQDIVLKSHFGVSSQEGMSPKEPSCWHSPKESEVSCERPWLASSHQQVQRTKEPNTLSLVLDSSAEALQGTERTRKHILQTDQETVELHKLGEKKLWEFVQELRVQNNALQVMLEDQSKLMQTRELEHQNHFKQLEKELIQQRQAQTECLTRLQQHEAKVQDLSSDLQSCRENTSDESVKDLRDMIVVKRCFEVESITRMKLKTEFSTWSTEISYTHFSGYKYYVCITSRSFSVVFHLHLVQGEFDHLLKWPLKASFALELHHPRGGSNLKCISGTRSWKKPSQSHSAHVLYFKPNPPDIYQAFLELSELDNFIKYDKLSCSVVDFTIHGK